MRFTEKLKKNWIKYLFVLLPGLAMLYILLPIGDYSSGLVQGFGILFFSIFMIVSLLLITIMDITKTIKKVKRFDAIPSITMTSIVTVFALALFSDDNKFWTQRNLVAHVHKNHKNGILYLYENGTFAAHNTYVDFNMTYQGDYTIKGDTLHLEREELADITDSLFTTIYVRTNKTRWVTLNDNFNDLNVIESYID